MREQRVRRVSSASARARALLNRCYTKHTMCWSFSGRLLRSALFVSVVVVGRGRSHGGAVEKLNVENQFGIMETDELHTNGSNSGTTTCRTFQSYPQGGRRRGQLDTCVALEVLTLIYAKCAEHIHRRTCLHSMEICSTACVLSECQHKRGTPLTESWHTFFFCIRPCVISGVCTRID